VIYDPATARYALTLAGHTHGGQVRLFGYPLAANSPRELSYGHVVIDGRHVLVSGGLGTSILPVRFGVPPEIVWLRLGDLAAAA
jgi:predicted MPP superfamily phosphohydrolase